MFDLPYLDALSRRRSSIRSAIHFLGALSAVLLLVFAVPTTASADDPPTLSLTAAPSGGTATVSWSTLPASATLVEFRYRKYGVYVWEGDSTVPSTPSSAVVSDLTQGASYWFQARSVASDGVTSAWSPLTSLYVPNPSLVAPSLNLTALSGGNVIVSWADTGAYAVELSYTAGGGAPVSSSTVQAPATATELHGLTPGQQYWFAARSRDADGNVGAWSTSYSVTLPAPTAPNTLLVNEVPAYSRSDTAGLTIYVFTDPFTWTSSFECQVNDSGFWSSCDPRGGDWGGQSFKNAATEPDNDGSNKVAIRAIDNGVADPTPAVTHVWVDSRPLAMKSTVTTSTTEAGAHPALDLSFTVEGGHNLRSLWLDVPAGFNIATSATSEKCAVSDAVAGHCATSAPGSWIGSVTGEGVTGRDGYTNEMAGDLYLTESPMYGRVAGVAFDIQVPDGLGNIRAIGSIGSVQTTTHAINGALRTVLDFESVPQRTDVINPTTGMGHGVHLAKLSLNFDADPPGGSYPLLTNPTTCPATPGALRVRGASYFGPNVDGMIGTFLPPQDVAYPVSDCETLEFNPQVTHRFFMTDPMDGSTYDASNPGPSLKDVGSALFSNLYEYRSGRAGVVTTVAFGTPSSAVRRASMDEVEFYLPLGIGFGLAALGDSTAMCSGGSLSETTVFDPATCPATAKLGKVTLNSPLFPTPLVGDFYAINKSPLPGFGIDINPDSAPGNPAGLWLRLGVLWDTGQLPNCSTSAAPWCGTRSSLLLDNLPDLPIESIEFDLSGRTARSPQAGGSTLVSLPLSTPDRNDPNCKPNDQIVSQIKPNESSLATLTRTQNNTMSYCGGPNMGPVNVSYTNAATGATVATTPTETAGDTLTNGNVTASWTTTEIGPTVTCSLDGGPEGPCTSNTTMVLSGLSEGAHSLFVRIVTADGHDEKNVTVAWTVDSTPPTAPTATKISPTTVNWNRNGGLSSDTLQCKRSDMPAWARTATPTTCGTAFGTGAQSGNSSVIYMTTGKTYAIRAYDTVGNIATGNEVTW